MHHKKEATLKLLKIGIILIIKLSSFFSLAILKKNKIFLFGN